MSARISAPKFVVAASFTRGDQWLDQILAIKPLRTEMVITKLGNTEATIARVVAINDSGEVTDHGETPLFWSVVRGQLKQATPKTPWVAGRLVRVGNAYRLDDLSETDQIAVGKALDQIDAA